jgi:TRAP-type uncharacterized transport system substrate-binding protein
MFKERRMLKILLLLALPLIIMMSCKRLTGQRLSNRNEFLYIKSSNIGGAFYAGGSAWSRIISNNTDFLAVNSTSPTTENDKIRMLVDGKIHIAFLNAPEAYLAYHGDPVYWKGRQNIRALFALWPGVYNLITYESSAVRTINDIKGKRIATYSDRSINGDIINFLLSLYDITEGNTEIYKSDLSTVNENLILIPCLDTEKLKEFLKIFPFFYIEEFGKELGLENKMQLMTSSFAACSADLPEELAYQLTKLWWENLDFVKQYLPDNIELINIEDNRNGVPIPFHRGALRYLVEAGMINKNQ